MAVSGCFGNSSTEDSRRSQDPASLRGPTFEVTAATVNGKPRPLVPHAPVLIAFTQGAPEILGRAGCSLFSSNGIRITSSEINLPYRIHPIPNHPPACPAPRLKQDAWVKAFLASRPRWQLSPPEWKLGAEEDVRLTLTSGRTVLTLKQGKLQDMTGKPPPSSASDTTSAPTTRYSGGGSEPNTTPNRSGWVGYAPIEK